MKLWILVLSLTFGFLLLGCTQPQTPTPTPSTAVESTPSPTLASTPSIESTPSPSAECVISCPNSTNVKCGQPCPNELKGVCSAKVRYKTGVTVTNDAEAKNAFLAYTEYLGDNALYGEHFSVQLEFNSSSYHGVYKNHSYWKIYYKYYLTNGTSDYDNIYASDVGDIALLSCP